MGIVRDDSTFPVLEIDGVPERREPIGSKAKFWFRRENHLWLFKEARPGTGEDWAEKLAAELARVLGLPHAVVELAHHEHAAGIATKDFTDEHARGDLVHGNELLFEVDPAYPKERRYRVHEHTLATVQRVLVAGHVVLPTAPWPIGVVTPWDGFIGYLLLDALICNTDRHHQNWGVLVRSHGGKELRELAPTFDHASSLGRELSNDQRERALTTRDTRGDLRAYVARARSAFYDDGGPALNPTEAFFQATAASPSAGRAWLERLRVLTLEDLARIVSRMPGPTLSDPARQFALALLNETRTRLEALVV
jgi:hypothetical protein